MHAPKQKVNVHMVDKIIVDKDFVGNVWVKLILTKILEHILDIVIIIVNTLHLIIKISKKIILNFVIFQENDKDNKILLLDLLIYIVNDENNQYLTFNKKKNRNNEI